MKISATLATLLLLASAQAAAAGGYAGGYAGLGLGITKADYGTDEVEPLNDGSFTSMSTDTSDAAISFFVGANFTPNVGIEVAYTDLGEIGIGAVSDGSGPVYPAGTLEGSAELSALSLAMKAQAPLNDTVSLQGKIGIARWDADITAEFNGNTLGTGSESGTDPLISIGLSLKLNDALRLNLEATRYMDVGDYDTDVFGAALALRFQ